MNRFASLLLSAAVLISIVGCSSTPETKTDPMTNAWQVVQMGARNLEGMDAAMVPTLSFNPSKMTVSGSAGCNTYSGEYSNDINALSFGKVAVTKKMCPGEAMSIETQFLDVLNKTAKMKVEDNDLMLFDASGVEILKAKAQE